MRGLVAVRVRLHEFLESNVLLLFSLKFGVSQKLS